MYQITLNIDGMMCAMCESHVNDAVRNAFPVKKVTSSHSRGETVILSATAIPEAELRPVFTKLGYALTGYTCVPYEKKGLLHRHCAPPMATRLGGVMCRPPAACVISARSHAPCSTRAGWLPASLRPGCARRARRAQAPRAARPED